NLAIVVILLREHRNFAVFSFVGAALLCMGILRVCNAGTDSAEQTVWFIVLDRLFGSLFFSLAWVSGNFPVAFLKKIPWVALCVGVLAGFAVFFFELPDPFSGVHLSDISRVISMIGACFFAFAFITGIRQSKAQPDEYNGMFINLCAFLAVTS